MIQLFDLYFLLGMMLFLALCFYLLYISVFKPTWKWFRLCDDLEKEIRENDNYSYQIECLYELKKKSWHRSTGERIRELALMMELKYNVQILKR